MRMIHQSAMFAAAFLLPAGALPPASAAAQPAPISGPADLVGGTQVRAQVSAMLAAMKPGQGFSWAPLVRDDMHVAAIEIWKKPGLPAVHPSEAEYVVVLDGAGTLVSGGTLLAPVSRQSGLIEGSEIKGGTTRTLGAGDVFLVPAGVPHWFGITGDHLALLGAKLPTGR